MTRWMLVNLNRGKIDGRRILTVSHGGRDTGIRSYVWLLPDDGIGIVLASNRQETEIRAISRSILDLILTFSDE